MIRVLAAVVVFAVVMLWADSPLWEPLTSEDRDAAKPSSPPESLDHLKIWVNPLHEKEDVGDGNGTLD